MTKKRSLGLTLLGWFEILIGGGGGILTLLAMVCAVWYALGESSPTSFDQIFLFVLYVFSAVGPFTIVLFISGIGLLKRNLWVLKFNVFITPTALIIYLGIRFSLLKWGEGVDNLYLNMVIIYLFMLIQVSIIFYLTRPKVRSQFEKGECYLNGQMKYEHFEKEGKCFRREYDVKGDLIKEEEFQFFTNKQPHKGEIG